MQKILLSALIILTVRLLSPGNVHCTQPAEIPFEKPIYYQGFILPGELLALDPELVNLILATPSMNDLERQQWFNLLHGVGSLKNRKRLKTILLKEKNKSGSAADTQQESLEENLTTEHTGPDNAAIRAIMLKALYHGDNNKEKPLAPQHDKLPDNPATSPAQHKIWLEPTIDLKFVPVPGGEFIMGCGQWNKPCDKNALPPHKVRLSSFYMAATEVSKDQWMQVTGDKWTGPEPVENLSWFNAAVFANTLSLLDGLQPCYLLADCTGEDIYDYNCSTVKIEHNCNGFRLPTEAEWEYACRSGGKDERYCGGSRLQQLAWNGSDIFIPHPVGQKQANGLGIYDMTGNVMEWCQDRYGPYPAMQDAAMDPTGPETGYERVYRGGCINSIDFELRSTAREGMRPDFADYYFGIRLVRPIQNNLQK